MGEGELEDAEETAARRHDDADGAFDHGGACEASAMGFAYGRFCPGLGAVNVGEAAWR